MAGGTSLKTVCFLIAGLSALTVPPEHQNTYEQIVAYENLFQNIEIEYYGESYKRDETEHFKSRIWQAVWFITRREI